MVYRDRIFPTTTNFCPSWLSVSQSIKFLRHHKSLRKCSKCFQTKTDFPDLPGIFQVFAKKEHSIHAKAQDKISVNIEFFCYMCTRRLYMHTCAHINMEDNL
jgi:hypothetical protein